MARSTVKAWAWLWSTGEIGLQGFRLSRGEVCDQYHGQDGKPIHVTVTYDDGKAKRRKK